ncbi:ATP-binding protein [Marinobacter lutaoensis]|jgi:two-component system sensor histidine kinase RstB|uniref:histidine kinase n=1 Tax=Marinobacter lutaoensis TaxID=135739 RepID=A0A1V2DR18_9GAMM|nr:ATP-binding protein [Marinobacter lutaoensis]MBI42605.1 two-component sensor histidine kinase [Oceanospirillales bacterium]NVD34655.1 two-component sensor histidine kinase [Marinobacter lutaoensis]ONF42811.1 two-component sensor histidine kinase [Marinobacter lutaoensis]|tara:strand:+ start:10621 stop:12195 length:1575 start_codon:yes stop_codon:yes gene_type:complete
MPLTYLLKLYARLLAIAAAVVLLCVVLFNGLNAVRHQFWLERMPDPLMRWLASVPLAEEPYQWLSAWYGLTVASPEDLALPPVLQERLAYGQVVATETPVGVWLMVQTPAGDVLRLSFDEPYRDVANVLSELVSWYLGPAEADQRESLARQLEHHLGVRILWPDDGHALPGGAVLQRVSEQGLALYRESPEGPLNALLQLDDGALVGVALPAPFSPWAWPMVLLLLLVVGAVLWLALFLGVRELDSNLRKVESVAMRIARGEMGARVDAGHGTLVERLASAFNGMAEHIQRLVQVQREMIHAVSHELRTPVARIRFGVQMIEDCRDEVALKKQLDGIDGDIQELDELIDEILTYARLEQGGPVFSLREHSVTDIVRQVVSEQQVLRPQLEIEADIDEDTERHALSDIEPRYIHRAIQNLVGNAGRYARHRVRVRCRIDDDNCRVDVEDDGPGIPEQDWERVFTAFARLDDSRTRTSGGYGLGLSIVRRILYWHGGQAFVCRSDTLGGARFSLVWPRRKPEDAVL